MTAGQNIAQAKGGHIPNGLAIVVTMVAVVGLFVTVSALSHRTGTATAPAVVTAATEPRLEFLAENSGPIVPSYATTADAARIMALYGSASASFPGLASTTADAARVAALYGEQSWYASSADAARTKALYGDPATTP